VSLVRLRPVWMTNYPPSVLWLGHQTCKTSSPKWPKLCRSWKMWATGHHGVVELQTLHGSCCLQVDMSLHISVRNQMVPPCVEWWGEMDNQATTFFGCCPSMVYLLFGHIVRMIDEADAKILTASPLENWRRPTRTPLYYVDEDYPASPEIQ